MNKNLSKIGLSAMAAASDCREKGREIEGEKPAFGAAFWRLPF